MSTPTTAAAAATSAITSSGRSRKRRRGGASTTGTDPVVAQIGGGAVGSSPVWVTGGGVASTTVTWLVVRAGAGMTGRRCRVGVGAIGVVTIEIGRVASSTFERPTTGTSPVTSATPRSDAPHSMQNFWPRADLDPARVTVHARAY